MSEGMLRILGFAALAAVCGAIGYVGNKIADKGEDAIINAGKRKKDSRTEAKKENLADRYR